MRKKIISVISVISVFISLLIISSSITAIVTHHTSYANTTYVNPTLSITLKTSKPAYYLRENVNIYGNLTSDGSPISNGLVAVEVLDSLDSPMVYRTLPTDNVTVNGFIEIEAIPCDQYWNPVDSFKIGTWAYFKVTVRNTDNEAHAVAIGLCVFDGTMIALGSKKAKPSVPPGESYIQLSIEIPNWAYIGDAKAIGNAYTDWPKDGGVPYCLETSTSFNITRNPETQGLGTQLYSPTLGVEGTYNTTFKLSPEPRPGEYSLYASARRNDSFQDTAQRSATFEVQSTSSPPHASFFYSPPQPYVNQTVTFDASTSSAEGYNDTIISYKWNFGDGTPPVMESDPITTHVYNATGTYAVTLNVTDSEGLWGVQIKTIDILPPTGPTADFIWYPSLPKTNQTIRFDASSSQLGWNGTAAPPITSYKWDFDDGNVTTVTTPTINHTYTTEANYNVTLTITDAQGLQSNKTQTVIVSEAPLLVGDVNGDGLVDMRDIGIACSAYGCSPGDPMWNPRADVNRDDVVDMRDIGIICAHYGGHM